MKGNIHDGFRFGAWQAFPPRNLLLGPPGEIHIEPKVMQMLEYLASNPGQVVERETLLGGIWEGRAFSDEPLSRCIFELRQALGDSSKDPKYIETIPKSGYRLICTVESLADATDDASNDLGEQSVVHNWGILTGRRRIALPAFLGLILIAAVYVAYRSTLPDSIESSQPAVGATSRPETSVYSIAVLPFRNMSNDPDQEYFADGITEEILNTLVAIGGLRVAGRTSSFTFKEKTDVDLRTIGEMLGVANVLEGSVRKSGDRLRITAQLIKTDDGFHLWSQTYDRQVADIFDIQDEIATAIGEALKLELGIEVAQSIAVRRLDNDEAFDIWLNGRSQHRSGDYAGALESFADINKMEPDYLPPYGAQVKAYSRLLGLGQIDEATYLEKAQEILQRVTKLDRDSSERYFIAGLIYLQQRDWQGAIDAFDKRAELETDPELVFGARLAALRISGRDDQALNLMKNYLVAEPLDHQTRKNYALLLAQKGRLAEAEAELAKLMQTAPNNYETLALKWQFYARYTNELAEAIRWSLKRYQIAEKVEYRNTYALRLLLDLGADAAFEDWLNKDPAYTDIPNSKTLLEYFLARYRDDTINALRLAHTIGEHMLTMSRSFFYLEDLDWLRFLQQDDPDLALRIYKKRTPLLITKTPIVFDQNKNMAISLADLYLQTGEPELANSLLDQCLALIEDNGNHYDRAGTTMIYALKGDSLNALKSLRANIDANWRWDWWLLEKDPAYKILWGEPEFESMMEEIRTDMVRQRREFDAMVASGEIELTPRRNSS